MRPIVDTIAAVALATVAGVAAAPAQDLPGDPGAGYALASAVCDACHAVEAGARDADAGAAPSFQAVADDPAMTALALRVFLRTPHSDMPDLILTEAETDDIIAYMVSLKPGR